MATPSNAHSTCVLDATPTEAAVIRIGEWFIANNWPVSLARPDWHPAVMKTYRTLREQALQAARQEALTHAIVQTPSGEVLAVWPVVEG